MNKSQCTEPFKRRERTPPTHPDLVRELEKRGRVWGDFNSPEEVDKRVGHIPIVPCNGPMTRRKPSGG